MGGIGAVTLALKHPDLFVFAGGISSAIDVPTRAFSLKRMGQYRAHAAIFGSWGSEHRRQNDLFVLARAADSRAASYLVDRVLSRVPDVPPIAGDELPVKEPTRKRRSPLHR
jgi:S-formylglutathione hydrolase FrmB